MSVCIKRTITQFCFVMVYDFTWSNPYYSMFFINIECDYNSRIKYCIVLYCIVFTFTPYLINIEYVNNSKIKLNNAELYMHSIFMACLIIIECANKFKIKLSNADLHVDSIFIVCLINIEYAINSIRQQCLLTCTPFFIVCYIRITRVHSPGAIVE